MAKNKIERANDSFEKDLFKMADKLRKNMDAAEYKHIVLGLIFLKYISDSFEDLHSKLAAGKGDYEGARDEVKEALKKTVAKETPEKMEARIREDERQKVLAERGELNSETGQPKGVTGGRMTLEQLGNYDPTGKTFEEMQKDAENILKQIPK